MMAGMRGAKTSAMAPMAFCSGFWLPTAAFFTSALDASLTPEMATKSS